MIHIGLEKICSQRDDRLKGKRLALLSNQASTDRFFVHGRDLIQQTYPGQLVCLFSPQHGFFSEKQDNMIESDHGIDAVSGVPVYSLYGETRKPYPAMFEGVDTLLIDLIDVGTRVYTFIWTVLYCLQVASETGVEVVILDRPNPIGGLAMEGNVLDMQCSSFVGLHSLPMRHGLTVGEVALLCNRELEIGARLDVIPAEGWKRAMLFPETSLPWVFPSPNMPSFATALVYPGQVLWEGTNVSEARGTTLPFELFGAPFVEHQEVLSCIEAVKLPGCVLRPLCFEPTSGKWQQQVCTGFQIHVTDSLSFMPYRTSLALLQAMLKLYPQEFQYKQPPYEYEYEKLPMDMILGDSKLRHALEQGVSVLDLEAEWQGGLEQYRKRAQAVFLYE